MATRATNKPLDTSDINEPHLTPDQAQEKMNRILQGSRKGGATTREMIRYAKEHMPNWKEEAVGGGGEGSNKGDER